MGVPGHQAEHLRGPGHHLWVAVDSHLREEKETVVTAHPGDSRKAFSPNINLDEIKINSSDLAIVLSTVKNQVTAKK